MDWCRLGLTTAPLRNLRVVQMTRAVIGRFGTVKGCGATIDALSRPLADAANRQDGDWLRAQSASGTGCGGEIYGQALPLKLRPLRT
jgi:hypothetical protein